MRKLEHITPEQWGEVNSTNKAILEDFLTNSVELSEKSKSQTASGNNNRRKRRTNERTDSIESIKNSYCKRKRLNRRTSGKVKKTGKRHAGVAQ